MGPDTVGQPLNENPQTFDPADAVCTPRSPVSRLGSRTPKIAIRCGFGCKRLCSSMLQQMIELAVREGGPLFDPVRVDLTCEESIRRGSPSSTVGPGQLHAKGGGATRLD
jgi:hypothetical protein